MMHTLWNDYLFRPLLNALIWFYNNWAAHNLGWAVVLLTVALRCALLPFSVINERNAVRFARLREHLYGLRRSFKNDPVALNEEVRGILRRFHVSPWAKTLVLAVQGLVLVLLYQVFLGGIEGARFAHLLYSWNDVPGSVNTVFYSFDIAMRSAWWAVAVAVWLFLDLYLTERRSGSVTRAEAIFVMVFPLFVFLLLWWLPMVKALFILTSMLFSATITLLRRLVVKTPAGKKAALSGAPSFWSHVYRAILG